MNPVQKVTYKIASSTSPVSCPLCDKTHEIDWCDVGHLPFSCPHCGYHENMGPVHECPKCEKKFLDRPGAYTSDLCSSCRPLLSHIGCMAILGFFFTGGALCFIVLLR
jgi:transposase-like protein